MTPLVNRIAQRLAGRRSDAGATLVLVLALISVISLISVAILTLSETNLRASSKTQGTAEREYDEDGAMQAGVNTLRNSSYDNDVNAGQKCDPTSMAGPNGTGNYVVSCTPVAGTGAASSGSVSNTSNTPGSALLTVGTASEGGGIQRTGTGYLSINGQTYSRSTIVNTVGATNAIELISGQAFARSTCTGTITSTPAAACSTVLNPAGSTDPGYTQPTAGLTPRAVPSCGSSNVVQFTPGYYDDAAALTTLFTTCPTKIFWFAPSSSTTQGRYYFDFKRGESPQFVGSNIWTINNASTRLVAGTPLGWDPAAANPSPSFPGSCKSPLDSTNNGGVEFVFGGRSELSIAAGQVEICGHYSSTAPSTAVFGATTTDPALPTTPQTLGRASSANAGCSRGFNSQGSIDYSDSLVATADGTQNAGNPDACVTISGFAPSETIPTGSILENATLVVRHRERYSGGTFSAVLTPTRADGSTGSPITLTTSAITRQGSLTTQYQDVTANLFSEFDSNGYQGGTIKYTATRSGGSGTAEIDTVQLVLDWVPPSTRAQDVAALPTFTAATGTYSLPVVVAGAGGAPLAAVNYNATGTKGTAANCVGLTNYPSTGCAFIRTAASANAKLFVQGTFYAPKAALDLRQLNVSSSVVSNGVIVRKFYVAGLTTTARAIPIVSKAAISPPNLPLQVYLWSFRCINVGSCPTITTSSVNYPYLASDAANWKLVGTSKVQYANGAGFPGVVGNRDVTVLSWQFVSPSER